jgi:ribosomal protein S18 acetylase RimI-like enzyme
MSDYIRAYQDSDYPQCEALVNQAWGFDQAFSPSNLSEFVKILYTKGSVVNSNDRYVAEIDGKVVGFLFGLNEQLKKPGLQLGFRFSLLFKSFGIKNSTPPLNDLLKAAHQHEKNRSRIVNKKRSEIVLFVVDRECQGKGVGKSLWAHFKKRCGDSGVSRIVVETNALGAKRFYQLIGFEHLSDFDSPLHEIITPEGQACVLEYRF